MPPRDVLSGGEGAATAVRLADLNPADVDMHSVLIVGSSQTHWYSNDSGDRVFTPRRYPT
jgi:precorrin-2 C20-methyltransferase / precorrin-3B C17-methyltransferase